MLIKSGILLLALLVSCCYGDGELDVSIGDSDELHISLQGLPDPCEGHVCSSGEECTVIYHPALLEVPIAHCQPHPHSKDEMSDGGCRDYSVGTNVMSCKSEEEWKAIGGHQCALRGGNDAPLLIKTTVHTACHSFVGGAEPLFLKAVFTCCPEDYVEEPATPSPGSPPSHHHNSPPPHHHNPPPPHHHQPPPLGYQQPTDLRVFTDPGPTLTTLDERIYLFPLLGAIVVILAVVVTAIALMHRRRHKKALKKLKSPKVILATSFINPNVDPPPTDEWMDFDVGDRSLLIANPSPSSRRQ